jgi:hypothetical protein
METNTGRDYELLTQRVFQALHDQGRVRNVQVRHNIQLTGLSGVSRQIDVYWEFEMAGIVHRVVVECKAWSSSVPLEVVDALQGKLADLPGHMGVIVARAGFQEGAKQKAEAYKIALYELRAPTDEDWNGFITRVQIRGELFLPKIHALQFIWDDEWNRQEKERLGFAGETFTCSLDGWAPLKTEDGDTLTLNDVLNFKLRPDKVGPPEWREEVFSAPVYVPTGSSMFPRARALGVKMQVELALIAVQQFDVSLDAFVAHVLKEVSKGTFTMLDADGRPIDQGQPRPGRIAAAGDEGE